VVRRAGRERDPSRRRTRPGVRRSRSSDAKRELVRGDGVLSLADGALEAYQRWAWGNELTPRHANTVASDIGRTSAVGSHPAGRIPEWGVEDIIGNVWEWTSTAWVEDYADYAPRDDAAGSANRVLRGGAWYFDHTLARCAFRGSDAPDYRNYRIGFRVVVAAT
jgi:formylglycine-generating enzyme required for sulfatase activity